MFQNFVAVANNWLFPYLITFLCIYQAYSLKRNQLIQQTVWKVYLSKHCVQKDLMKSSDLSPLSGNTNVSYNVLKHGIQQ